MGHDPDLTPTLCLDSRGFFTELVTEACEETNFETIPQASEYLVEVLLYYMFTDRLFDEEDISGKKKRETLAEMFLKAGSAQRRQKVELLKKLGDTALYVSGFFGESLQRKIVDLDYYMEMGESAYGSLAKCVNEDTSSKVFHEISRQFTGFVDVLTYISSRSIRPVTDNLLQLFENYVSGGSEFARDQIFGQGLIAVPAGDKKYKQ